MKHIMDGHEPVLTADDLDLVTDWVKSSFSSPNGNCAEFAKCQNGDVAMRNSRDPQGPVLVYTRDELAAMIAGCRKGDFNHLLK